MPDLGLEVLLKGKNLARILGGLDAALKISMISVAISIPLGIILGILMTWKNPICRAILRCYLEFVRMAAGGGEKKKRISITMKKPKGGAV